MEVDVSHGGRGHILYEGRDLAGDEMLQVVL